MLNELANGLIAQKAWSWVGRSVAMLVLNSPALSLSLSPPSSSIPYVSERVCKGCVYTSEAPRTREHATIPNPFWDIRYISLSFDFSISLSLPLPLPLPLSSFLHQSSIFYYLSIMTGFKRSPPCSLCHHLGAGSGRGRRMPVGKRWVSGWSCWYIFTCGAERNEQTGIIFTSRQRFAPCWSMARPDTVWAKRGAGEREEHLVNSGIYNPERNENICNRCRRFENRGQYWPPRSLAPSEWDLLVQHCNPGMRARAAYALLEVSCQ